MSTNYYAVTPPCENPCSHCAKSELVHICKNGTSFRGYVAREWDDLPLGDIRSWVTWREVLRSARVVAVEDEYGDRQDVEEFIAYVEGTSLEARGRQHKWMVDHYRPADRPDDWLDKDGFSFHDGAFS